MKDRVHTRHLNRGFTLIEVLAAILLTGMVVGSAVGFYINLADATGVATERTREVRNATAVLDRVARDLESSFLLSKPDEVDPLDHPWIFVAESRHMSAGADHLKFVTRNHRPSRTDDHGSDMGMVSYSLVPTKKDGYTLLRLTSSRLPETLDRRFATEDDEGALTLANSLRSFSIRFMEDSGNWLDEWDSSQIEKSGAIPRAVHINIAFLPQANAYEEDESEVYSRRLVLPVRPIPIGEIIEDAVSFGFLSEATTSDTPFIDCQPPGCKDKSDEFAGEPPAANCEMSMVQCLEIPKNAAKVRAALGEQGFQECRALVAQHPLCVEEMGAAGMCGVRIQCWY